MRCPRILTTSAAALALGLIVANPRVAYSQTVCIQPGEPDSLDLYLKNKVSVYIQPPDSTFNQGRIALQLPFYSVNLIEVVTHEPTCKKVRDAYQAKVAGIGGGLSGRVLVLRLNNIYVALDPPYAQNPAMAAFTHMTMDSKFKVLATWP